MKGMIINQYLVLKNLLKVNNHHHQHHHQKLHYKARPTFNDQ